MTLCPGKMHNVPFQSVAASCHRWCFWGGVERPLFFAKITGPWSPASLCTKCKGAALQPRLQISMAQGGWYSVGPSTPLCTTYG